jgi:hypothetical protein
MTKMKPLFSKPYSSYISAIPKFSQQFFFNKASIFPLAGTKKINVFSDPNMLVLNALWSPDRILLKAFTHPYSSMRAYREICSDLRFRNTWRPDFFSGRRVEWDSLRTPLVPFPPKLHPDPLQFVYLVPDLASSLYAYGSSLADLGLELNGLMVEYSKLQGAKRWKCYGLYSSPFGDLERSFLHNSDWRYLDHSQNQVLREHQIIQRSLFADEIVRIKLAKPHKGTY